MGSHGNSTQSLYTPVDYKFWNTSFFLSWKTVGTSIPRLRVGVEILCTWPTSLTNLAGGKVIYGEYMHENGNQKAYTMFTPPILFPNAVYNTQMQIVLIQLRLNGHS